MINEKVQWRKAAQGIRYRLHPTRKHGKQPDRYYVIRYTVDGQKKQEALGWLSEGWTLDEVQKQLSVLKSGLKTGEGPQTLADKRRAATEKRKADEARQAAEQSRLVSVSEYFEQYYLPFAKRTKMPQSWDKEVSHFTHWINPALGHFPVAEISFQQWEVLLKMLDNGTLAPRTRQYIAGTMRRILRHASERGFDIKIPTDRQLGVAAKDNRRLRVLTPKESEDILTELEKRNIYAWRVTKFAMLTGCRAGEAFSLRWRDVSMEEKQLCFADTKNKDDRFIPLSPAVIDLLSGFGPGRPGALVFPRPGGSKYAETPETYRAVVKSLGLNDGHGRRDRVCFHTIRHTVATQLARSLDVRSLMDIMGWREISMAARYIHSNEDTKRAAMAALEKTLAPQGPAKVIPFATG